ncbi:peroxiredoxin family protein [Marichromatium bheemlicum]|uniref:TlpA family protein disulfide reductase n=1 Tax=Marichromatium bheemlicum TaxID=365339 RepID=A0ABX1I656_9GAMM|nr:TlpA disulfide reductase family protein [Marichromatium bheemlicum]NKN31695.1 TlpA family protein disulfide reductase [Marichromatium bheemlicum]
MPQPHSVLALLLLLSSILAGPLQAETLAPLPAPQPAPGFTLQSSGGAPVALADYRGRVVILNFWATWCPPCRDEMPSMQRAYEALAADGVEILAINVDEDAATIAEFGARLGLDFPLLVDPASAVTLDYGVRGLPTSYVVDRDGRLVFDVLGDLAWDDPEVLDQVRALTTP